MAFREITLPSGAVLKVAPAPFAESKALYQAILEEARGIAIGSKTEMTSVFKDLLCIGFSSQKIEATLWTCMQRCLYGERKIDKDTFEPVERREDYITVCMEVTKENVLPFVKNLSAEWSRIIAMTESTPA